MLKPGDAAPSFTAKDYHGKDVKLEDLRGKRAVLWFYPKADTPGCTREGCGFRDLLEQYAAKGVAVLGISYDTPEENRAFAEKYRFTFPLLSDPGGEIAKRYGAWKAEQAWPNRHTYVIGPDGKLLQVLTDVNAKTHPKALLDTL